MSRLRELESRRQALLERSERQRRELSTRLGQLRRAAPERAEGDGRAALGLGAVAPRHPLAWALALAGLLLLGRKRDVVGMLARLSTALTIVSRAARMLRLVRELRRANADEGTSPARSAH